MVKSVEPTLLLQKRELTPQYDLVCLSHLRWDFVYQRPQHLLSRCAREHRVFFIEEPVFDEAPPYLHISKREKRVWVLVPHLPPGSSEDEASMLQARMIDEFFSRHSINNYVLWYYTPMALAFTNHLEPLAIIYDCMDELSAFQQAPTAMIQHEAELLIYADLVFTGGQSLYEAKRHRNRHVHAFPSSVDRTHFARAREIQEDPSDIAHIPHPRLGFYGVIDERMNFDLLAEIADARPDWHLVLIGPVVKIEQHALPQRENIHYLGERKYKDLPTYLASWDVALMPFAHNQATRFISPTKTLEYLAGGKPVISTSIRDVVSPYGQQGLVSIADTADEFIEAIENALYQSDPLFLERVDTFLSQTSWDATWGSMQSLIDSLVIARRDWLPYSVTSSLVQPALVVEGAETSTAAAINSAVSGGLE